jgi:hypothetical protein
MLLLFNQFPLLYYVIYPSTGSDPTAAQIKAGQDATSSPAVASGAEYAITVSGTETFAVAATGLTPSTSYRVALVWSDGTTDSNVVVSDPFVTSSGGGDVSLALTGQSITVNLGNLAVSVTYSVTGNSASIQQGTVKSSVSQSLTGQSVSLAQGSISSDVSNAITGQEVSLGQGSILSDISIGITGQQLSVEQGSVTNPDSSDVTKPITGQSLSVSQGTLTSSIGLALNGQSIVISGGSVSSLVSSALTGQQASVHQGNISSNIFVGLTGQSVVVSNGNVFQAGDDVTKALTGQQLSIALGTIVEKKTIARPSSDTIVGSWLPSVGTSLYATLDEVSPDDSDYIYTNSVSTCKIALNAVADPLTSFGQVVSYRVWSPNSDGLTVRLMQGSTEIASWTHASLPTSPTTYQRELTPSQCDAITDYSALAIQLESL